MNQKEKIKIVELLDAFVVSKSSQNKAAAALKDVTVGTISKMRNRQWEGISDAMFRNVGNQLGYNSQEWVFVGTTNAKMLLTSLNQARQQATVMTVLADAGSGKTEISKRYTLENPNTMRVECTSYWDEKYFLQEILQQMGVKNPPNRVTELMREIISRLKDYDTPPQLLIDEVDKLGDKLLYFLITFYNELKWKCSIVLLSTYYFKKRLQDGLRNRKKGYEELWSRYGNFYEFEQTSGADVELLCQGQGISDKAIIQKIKRSSGCDLRQASELIRIYKMESHV